MSKMYENYFLQPLQLVAYTFRLEKLNFLNLRCELQKVGPRKYNLPWLRGCSFFLGWYPDSWRTSIWNGGCFALPEMSLSPLLALLNGSISSVAFPRMKEQ